MSAIDLAPFFEERFAEIEAYLAFLQNIEEAAREGTPRLRGTDAAITTDQKKILNSSLYLQLYNLVEATVLRCLDAVVGAVERAERSPGELSIELRTEWVRSIARTHVDLNPEKRLQAALELCEQLVQQMPVKGFLIDPGGGGNWDDIAIHKICERVGCGLTISPDVARAAKQPIRDGMGALKLVKDRRNSLAHGSLSFVDCSDGVTVGELRVLTAAVGDYLREAVESFVTFIEDQITQVVPSTETEGLVA